jgi:c-di-GMP-binding flagellar brake protein YcgR
MLRNKIQGLEATDPDFPQLSLAERRKKLRIRTYIRLEIRVSDANASAIVTDLSLDGMRLRCNYALEEGDLVEVVFPDREEDQATGAVQCRAVWVTNFGPEGRETYEAGLSFQDSHENMQQSWVKYVLEQLGFDQNKTFQKRRYLRASGKIPARVFTCKDDESITGEIVNLGVGGALLSSKTAVDQDTVIHCEICLWRILPALRIPCRVVSVREDSSDEGEETHHLHSLLFLGMDTEQVKLLGNYVIFLINQAD